MRTAGGRAQEHGMARSATVVVARFFVAGAQQAAGGGGGVRDGLGIVERWG